MKERIKELYEQAHIERQQEYFSSVVDPTIKSVSVTRHFDLDLFAELIVEEMYDFMCKATENDGAWPSSKEVKQHFGVDGMSTEDKKTLIKELLGVKNETNQ